MYLYSHLGNVERIGACGSEAESWYRPMYSCDVSMPGVIPAHLPRTGMLNASCADFVTGHLVKLHNAL